MNFCRLRILGIMANLNFSDIMGLRSSQGFWDFLGVFRLNNNMDLMDFFCSFSGTGMQQAGKPGGPRPPQILADQKAPPGSGSAPHYYLPPPDF